MYFYQATMSKYRSGDKEGAFKMFRRDGSAAYLTFPQFCNAFDKMLERKRREETNQAAIRAAMDRGKL